MGLSRTFRIADSLLGGDLDRSLRRWRKAGCSFDHIASELASTYGVTVTAETVRVWCMDLGIHQPASK